MRHLLFAGLAACAASPGGAQVPLTLDTSFRSSITYGSLTDALPLAGGMVWITGYFTYAHTTPTPKAIRLLVNGAADPEIQYAALFGGTIHETAQYLCSAGGSGPRRINFDGTSQYFNPGSANTPYPGFVDYDWGDIAIQSDGKILCTGSSYLTYDHADNAAGWYSVFRLCVNARLDSTYDMRTTDGTIWSLEPTGAEQFFASGVFTNYDGVPVGRIVRIWANGELDTTYHCPIQKGYAKCFIHQPDGRMIVGGQFVLPNEPDTMHLIRLMPDGALDSTFHNHTEYKHETQFTFGDFAFSVNDIEQLENGNIIVGGSFTHMDGQLRRGIALVDSSGNLLNTAFTGAGCGLAAQLNSNSMYSGLASIDPAPDGSIYLVGEFNGFDDGLVSDTSQRMICRLHGLHVGEVERTGPTEVLTLWPNPAKEQLTISWPGHIGAVWRILSSDGGELDRGSALCDQVVLDVRHFAEGMYTITMQDAHGAQRTAKWIKQ